MPISCAVLMCHAPTGSLLSLGGLHEFNRAETNRAMRDAARALVAHDPQLIVLVSPHAPRHPQSWGIVSDARLLGRFPEQRKHEPGCAFRGSPLAAEKITQLARSYGLSICDLPGTPLHPGALLPLSHVQEAGYRGPVIIVTPPLPGSQTEVLFGEVLREAALSLKERWAVLASGDMGQPFTFEASLDEELRVAMFDEVFVELVRAGDLRRAIGMAPPLPHSATEDVIQSTAVAAGAIAFRSRGRKVFSYDSPFGIDPLEALLYSDRAEINHRAPPAELLEVARRAIESELSGEPYLPPTLDVPWYDARAVFVTLRNERGELRGAVGRTEPVHSTLAEEIADCATAAATRDYRFLPIELDELPKLLLELTVLEDPEPVTRLSELDPRKFGLIVSCGLRRSMVLPNTDNVTTSEAQLQLALERAGIAASEPYRMERFSVSRSMARMSNTIELGLPWLD